MNLQVCHCGWSKVTTYHGLRTHQGKMGCTPKGVKVEESDQLRMYVGLDVYTSFKTDYYSDMSLQVCHCGWSKMTTYHGLRTHQGMMGCTQQGIRIPESDQYKWKNRWEEENYKKYQPAKRMPVKKENLPSPPSVNVRMKSAVTVKQENKPYFKTSQLCLQSDTSSTSSGRDMDFSTDVKAKTSIRVHPTSANLTAVRPKVKNREDQPSQTRDNRMMKENWSDSRPTISSSVAATIKEEPGSPLAIPRRPSQRATSSKSGGRQHVLSSDVQVNTSALGRPAPAYPVTVVRPKEKDRENRKDQKSSQMTDSRAMTENWSIINRTSSALMAARIKEEPKSPLAIPGSKSGRQQHDLSTGVQVNRSAKERPPIPPRGKNLVRELPTTTHRVVRPQEKHREDQTLLQNAPVSKSLNSPEQSLKRVTNSTASPQLQDVSSCLQVNNSGRERLTAPPLATAAQPEHKDGKDQTLSEAKRASFKTELQQKIHQREEKMSEIIEMEGACESVPDSMSTNSQTKSAAEETEDPKSLHETTQPEFSTGMTVKDLAQMFSATAAQQTSVQPKWKQREDRKQTQVENLAKDPSATTDQETAGQPKEKEREVQKPSQNVPESTNAAAQENPASAEATAEEDPKSSSETAQRSDSSAGVKVKDLARMFSATTAQGTTVRPRRTQREEHQLPQVKLMAQKHAANAAQETAGHQKRKDNEDQKLSQNVTTRTTNQMNPVPAEATTEEDPESSCETAQRSDFSSGLKVKELARMFSAAAAQHTAARPKWKHGEDKKKWM